MTLNRAALKADARDRMRRYKPNPILMGLIVVAIAWLLQILSMNVLGLSRIQQYFYSAMTSSYANYAEAMEKLNEQMMQFWTNYHPSAFARLLAVALGIMNLMINVGFTIYALHVCREEKADFGNLFDGFGIIFRVLWLSILEYLFIMLWSLLLFFPGIIAMYRYRQAIYLLIEHPEMSAMQCITASKELMRGHKWELFVLDLSFLGWDLLEALVFPLVIWLLPYKELTSVNYYRALVEQPGAQNGNVHIYEGKFTDIPDDHHDDPYSS